MTDDKNTAKNEPENKTESWERWTVKPVLEAMFAEPPESGIGKRIAYCRGQLDNLSLDALARYTKFFDDEGISRGSIFRYEAGKAIPGGRELRILSDALWIPANWLLLGNIETDTEADTSGRALLMALDAYASRNWGASGARLKEMVSGVYESADKREIRKRQQWIDQARKAQPR